MDEMLTSGRGGKKLVKFLCLVAFGTTLFPNPLKFVDPYGIAFGIVVMLLFGWLYKLFLKALLSMFNGKVKKEKGKQVIGYCVDTGMVYLLPFATMAILAVYYLHWSATYAFISTGIMAVGTASAIEMGRFLEKPSLKNTIITSGISFLFSFILTLGIPFLTNLPGMIEGLATLIPTLLGQGGGLL